MHGGEAFLSSLALVLCVAALTTVAFQRLGLPHAAIEAAYELLLKGAPLSHNTAAADDTDMAGTASQQTG